MGFLRYDSDFMVMLGRIADYVILNVLCVIFSIPLFTVGAAVTAKYYVAISKTITISGKHQSNRPEACTAYNSPIRRCRWQLFE